MTNENVKAAKKQAMPIDIHAVEEYKNSNDFENNAIEARMDVYIIKFLDCKCKVARAYTRLDLSNIQAEREVPKEEEEKAVEDGAIERPKADEVVVEEPGPEIAATKNPEEVAVVPK